MRRVKSLFEEADRRAHQNAICYVGAEYRIDLELQIPAPLDTILFASQFRRVALPYTRSETKDPLKSNDLIERQRHHSGMRCPARRQPLLTDSASFSHAHCQVSKNSSLVVGGLKISYFSVRRFTVHYNIV
jgi:hypothetical protein